LRFRASLAAALVVAALGAVGAGGAIVACGSDGAQSTFGDDSGTDGGDNSEGGDPFGRGEGGALDGSADAKACTNLCLQQVTCPNGGTTSISGKVYDPAGKVPLYNVVVYVPNAPGGKVDPITTGASCDKCGIVSGDPLVSTLTDATGSFTLPNMPVGKDIPLVIQVGKWRRQLKIPSVASCVDTKMTDPQVTRLPKNQSEGDMPQMAIASGFSDPFECLLLKMGIDPIEFVRDTDPGSGRVHYYESTGVDLLPASPDATTLWNDLSKMMKHDIIMLPCEGQPIAKPDQGAVSPKSNLLSYANAGGRVFTTHYAYVWLAGASVTGGWDGGADLGPFIDAGAWAGQFPVNETQDDPAFVTNIDQTFPKGDAYAHWLVNVSASSTLGQLTVIESRHDLVKETKPAAQRWNYEADFHGEGPGVMHMTFNTPLGAADDKICGRVVFSDFHVSASAKTAMPNFPASCKIEDLTPQEKALEFMFFDLSSCIQSDQTPPTPPGGGIH
jgi:hypothetical protein